MTRLNVYFAGKKFLIDFRVTLRPHWSAPFRVPLVGTPARRCIRHDLLKISRIFGCRPMRVRLRSPRPIAFLGTVSSWSRRLAESKIFSLSLDVLWYDFMDAFSRRPTSPVWIYVSVSAGDVKAIFFLRFRHLSFSLSLSSVSPSLSLIDFLLIFCTPTSLVDVTVTTVYAAKNEPETCFRVLICIEGLR